MVGEVRATGSAGRGIGQGGRSPRTCQTLINIEVRNASARKFNGVVQHLMMKEKKDA